MNKRLGIASFLLLSAVYLYAQQQWQFDTRSAPPARMISVDQAVELALQNNLSLQAGKVTLQKKKRPADYFWNQFLPAVGFSGSLGAANEVTSQSTFDFSTMQPITVEGPRWSMSGAFQIQWQGLNYAMLEGIKQLRKSYEAGEVTYQKAKIQLERDVRKLYNSILLAEENLKVQERSYTLAEEQVKTATANFRAGLSAELNLMQARLNRDNMIPSIDQVRNNIKISKANLAMLLGLPFETEFVLESVAFDSFNMLLDTRSLINNAVGNKIDIQELRANIVAARSARDAIRFQLWTPSIGLSWGVAPSFQGDPFRDEWKDGSWKDTGRFSLSLSWSLNGLLPWTTQAANLNDMNDDLRVLDINLAQLIRSTEVDVYNTVFLLEQARESAAAQVKTVDLARRTYNDTLAAFRAGLRDFLEVQNVEQQLRQAQLGVLQQQFNFLNGVIDLEYATGLPFGTLQN